MKLNIESVAIKPFVEEVFGMIDLKAYKPVKIDVDIPDNLSLGLIHYTWQRLVKSHNNAVKRSQNDDISYWAER